MKPDAMRAPAQDSPEVDAPGLLDGIITATERQHTTDAVLHVYSNLEAYERIAAGIAKAGMTHHQRSADVITIALAAHELQLPLMTALRGMYVVHGKLAVETWLMELLAARLGVTKTIVENTDTRAEVTLHRPGTADVSSAFTLDDAERAGLIAGYTVADDGRVTVRPAPRRDTWAKYPRTMLYWRAVSQGLRQIAPDAFGGMYVPDETAGFSVRPGAGEGKAGRLNAALGVDPDPDAMTTDEVEAYSAVMRAAARAGLIAEEHAAEAVEWAVAGEWTRAREEWVRTARLLEVQAEAERVLDSEGGA